ncbi:MAG: sigma-70 family RNA polymerase sigma factor [Gemmatimonadaceae bacterium]
MTTPDDGALVHRTLQGDSTAFAELVRRYRRTALLRALAIVGDHADADDVAQEAFVHAYGQLANCRDPARFGAWLLTIVQRRALNAARAARRRRTDSLDQVAPIASNSPHPGANVERGDLRRVLLDALRTLSPVQREVVLLADVEQLSHASIADALGLSVLMSRRHLSDARRRLRAILSSRSADL